MVVCYKGKEAWHYRDLRNRAYYFLPN